MNWLYYLAAPWGSGVGVSGAGGTAADADEPFAWLIIIAAVVILPVVMWLTKRDAP